MIPILDAGLKILDKVIPDPNERERAKRELVKLEQQGDLNELQERTKILLAEAGSDDAYVSRARPTFLYVMYSLLLGVFPFSFYYMIDPENAQLAVTGAGVYLNAIPGELYMLFGAGYLGYSHYRSRDKSNKNAGFLSQILR